MPAQLPYVAFPGSFNPALEKIRWAATPGCVTMDFATIEQNQRALQVGTLTSTPTHRGTHNGFFDDKRREAI
jgi:hypothetical protein